MAEENLSVIYDHKLKTAMIDLVNRVVKLPVLNDLDGEIYEGFVSHEIGHALFTPTSWYVGFQIKYPKIPNSFLNIVDDIRINSLVKKRYPGCVKVFSRYYSKLYNIGMFGGVDNNSHFLDRCNVAFKAGSIAGMVFADDEMPWVYRLNSVKTPEEAEEYILDLHKWLKEKKRKQKEEEEQARQAAQKDAEQHENQDQQEQDGSEGEDDSSESNDEGDSSESNEGDEGDEDEESSDKEDKQSGEEESSDQGNDESGSSDAGEQGEDETDETGSSGNEDGDSDDEDETSEASGGSSSDDSDESNKEGSDSTEDASDSSNESTESTSDQSSESPDKVGEQSTSDTSDDSSSDTSPSSSNEDDGEEEAPTSQDQFDENFQNTMVQDLDKPNGESHNLIFKNLFTYEDLVSHGTVVPAEKLVSYLRNPTRKFMHGETEQEAWDNLENKFMKKSGDSFESFVKEITPIVNNMVKIFMQKKSAKESIKTQQSKLGVLDMQKLHAYKYDDDVFLTDMVHMAGQNHGFIMYLDFSGSMHTTIFNAYKNILVLSLFCRKVNIPFTVYTFTSLSESQVSNVKYYNQLIQIKKGEQENVIGAKENFLDLMMYEILNSELNKKNYELLASKLYTYTKVRQVMVTTKGSYLRSEGYDHRYVIFNMQGTPLTVTMAFITPVLTTRFIRKYSIEKCVTFFVTDGDQTDDLNFYNPKRGGMSNFWKGEVYHIKNEFTGESVTLSHDNEQKMKISTGVAKYYLRDRMRMEDLVLEFLYDSYVKVTGSKIFRVRIHTTATDRFQSTKRDALIYLEKYLDVSRNTLETIYTNFMKDHILHIDSSENSEHFLIRDEVFNPVQISSDLKSVVKGDAKAAAREFAKSSKNLMKCRFFFNKIIEIAA